MFMEVSVPLLFLDSIEYFREPPLTGILDEHGWDLYMIDSLLGEFGA